MARQRTINGEDQRFLHALGGEIHSGKTWKLFERRGRVLLIMPAKGSSARTGSRLYSPQKSLAKIFTALALRSPGWKLLPGVEWNVDEASPLGSLMAKGSFQVGAVLLGNPTQEGRRALVLTDEAEPRVFKVGVGNPASGLVLKEREFMRSSSGRVAEIPDLVFSGGGEDWEAFGVPYFSSGPEVALTEVVSLLSGWLESEARLFRDLPAYEIISNSDFPETREILDACHEIELKPSVVHGDLANWNIRRRNDGTITLIDWENGRAGDVPCWDAVHFVFQQAALVEQRSSLEIRERVMTAMETEELALLISDSGWLGNERSLFASYLIAMATETHHVANLLPTLV